MFTNSLTVEDKEELREAGYISYEVDMVCYIFKISDLEPKEIIDIEFRKISAEVAEELCYCSYDVYCKSGQFHNYYSMNEKRTLRHIYYIRELDTEYYRDTLMHLLKSGRLMDEY